MIRELVHLHLYVAFCIGTAVCSELCPNQMCYAGSMPCLQNQTLGLCILLFRPMSETRDASSLLEKIEPNGKLGGETIALNVDLLVNMIGTSFAVRLLIKQKPKDMFKYEPMLPSVKRTMD